MHRWALVVGLFVVPVLLLWLGDGLRKKSRRQRRLFWGIVIGHSTGMVVTFFALMLPPIWWGGGGAARVWIAHWAMLIGSAAGALWAVARGGTDEEPAAAPARARPRAVAQGPVAGGEGAD